MTTNQLTPNQPTNQTKPARSEYPADNAGGLCIGAEEAAGKSIAVNRVDKLPTGNGGGQPRNGSMETQQAQFYKPMGFARNCDHCGREYMAKRNTSKFCGGACRVAAHKIRHGEAGGGRVMTFVWLAVVAAVAWFLWPLANDLAAMRPRLPQTAVTGQTAVNQAGQGVALQPTPTLAPTAAAAWPETAVTGQTGQGQGVVIVSAADNPQCVNCGTVIPGPWETAVTPAAAMPEAKPAGLIRIEAAGRVWELPIDRLNDCIIAQTAGRRTGNNCPPNAAAALAGATLPQMAAPGAALAGAGAELLHPEAAYIDVSRFGDAIAYCLAGDWTPDQRAAVANGFAIWQPAGVTFYEVANWGECETAVSWSNELGADIAGRATVGPGEIMLSTYWAANGCDLAMMAAHEAGHNLGLNDQAPTAGGLMTNGDCYQTGPTAAELAAVALLWGTK